MFACLFEGVIQGTSLFQESGDFTPVGRVEVPAADQAGQPAGVTAVMVQGMDERERHAAFGKV
jgi:hypothetical protein